MIESTPTIVLPWESWLVPPPSSPTRGRILIRRGSPRIGCGVRMVGLVPSLDVPTILRGLGPIRRKRDGGVTGSLGIDLAERGNEVRKLFYAGGFTGTLIKQGIDPEDFLQEVYRGILARDRGSCPWDAKKSSFGHYVYIVIKCVLSNYLRKDRRRTSHEDLTSDGLVVDGAVESLEGGEEWGRREILRDLFPSNWELAQKVVSLVEMGMGRKEVSVELGVPVHQVDGILKTIRESLTP